MTSSSSPPPRIESDPSPSFDKERDEFIQTFFNKGARFTRDLLQENQQLHRRITELERGNAVMRLQIKSDEAIHELLAKIESLEEEKDRLVSEFHEAKAKSSAIELTYSEVENELSNLASLYVASRQLHASMNASSVVQQLKEILEQLVGAATYGVYFLSDDGARLVRIAGRGLEDDVLARVEFSEGPIGRVFSTGAADITEDGDLSTRGLSTPAACIPLRIADRVVGVIGIFSTLEQKKRFLPVDYEFFKLLSGHAASAIVAARLFADADQQVPGVESFLEHGV